jgi:EmrB/QacA subfamily drug resistance transporter
MVARTASERTDPTTSDANSGGKLPAIPAQVWRISAVVIFGAFMSNLDTSLVNVGLDTIGGQMNSPLGSVQWVTNGYLLALAGALPLSGWLGRRIGVGRLWLWALVAFTVASGLCAVAPSIEVLIALRVAQGLAGGLLTPAGQTIMGQAAGPSRMGRVMNTVGIALVLAPALGPTIGGLLIAHLSWRWLFLINLPVGLVAFALGLWIVPRGERGVAGPLDFVGFLLVGSGLPLLSYGIITASAERSVTGASAWASIVVGILALVLFVRRSLRSPAPLLDLRLFGNRVYTAASISVFFTGAALFGGMIILPLYFELLRGEPVVATGLLLASYGVGAVVAMSVGGRLTDRFGGVVSVAGLTLTVATTIPLALFDANASLVGIEILLFLRGIGLGLAGLPAMSVAYATVARDKLPDATGQSNILRRVGASLGGALFVVVLENNGGSTDVAFQTTFWWLTGASIVALGLALWLTSQQRRATAHDN